MCQCDCNGCVLLPAAPAVLTDREREAERERDRVLRKHVNAAAERCNVRDNDHTEALG